MKVAVLLPCYNEEGAIGDVIRNIAAVLPNAGIYVIDNNSSDRTAREAHEAGAIVVTEPYRGKGHVVRRMFSEVEADIYLMVDGDGTYDVTSAPRLVDMLSINHLDMVVGRRIPVCKQKAYRPGHVFGNQLLTMLARFFFGRGFTDMLSGYRVFSRRFVKSFPVMSTGFEIETEMTVHCLSLNLPHAEVDTAYRERTRGTHSKLRTYRDGLRIMLLMVRLFKDYRPLLFFTMTGALLAITGVYLFLPLLEEYLATGQIFCLPLSILSVGLIATAFLSVNSGLVLDSMARMRLENRKLSYLLQSTQVNKASLTSEQSDSCTQSCKGSG